MTSSPLLIFHIIVGAVAIGSGFVSLSSKKGSLIHLRAGRVFLLSMLLMCSSGSLLSWFAKISISFLMGLFTLYLVVTGWRASNRFKQAPTWWDVLGMVAVISIALSLLYLGSLAANSPTGHIEGIPIGAGPYFFFGFLSLFAGLRDLTFIFAATRTRKQAQTTHIWRIGLALFIATASFFTGNPQVFPEWANEAGLTSIPERVVLLLISYYLLKRWLSPLWSYLQQQVTRFKNGSLVRLDGTP